jgi:hypothetical protein
MSFKVTIISESADPGQSTPANKLDQGIDAPFVPPTNPDMAPSLKITLDSLKKQAANDFGLDQSAQLDKPFPQDSPKVKPATGLNVKA